MPDKALHLFLAITKRDICAAQGKGILRQGNLQVWDALETLLTINY
jgi:hypothetical protein